MNLHLIARTPSVFGDSFRRYQPSVNHTEYVATDDNRLHYEWRLRLRSSNGEYVKPFDDNLACEMLEDAGFEPVWSRTVDGDSVWIRFVDHGKDVSAGRIDGADFISTTDLQSACGEPGILVESRNVWSGYTVRDGENYLTFVKGILSSCGPSYEEACAMFARAKRDEGIVAARKAFRMCLYEAMLSYGACDPNGYGPGHWTAKTDDRIIPCLEKAIDVA